MSPYGDAIGALRELILLEEGARKTPVDLARGSQEVAELRDRVSRIEGMLAAMIALSRGANPPRDRLRLPEPPDQTS